MDGKALIGNKRAGRLPDLPAFLDSPMAIDASGLYRRLMDEHRFSATDCDDMCRAAPFVNTAEQSKSLSQRGGPMITILQAVWRRAAVSYTHLKAFAGEKRNLVLLTGF